MSIFRPNIDEMAPYVPGEQPPAGAKVIKLNTNENPYPPSPRVAEAIRAELDAGVVPGDRLRLYSDPKALALREAAGEAVGLPVEQVLHGNGSDELLAMLMRGVIGEGQAIAYPYPTYVLYETLAQQQAATIRVFDFPKDFALPKELFGCDAKIVFIANPNSPSGTLYEVEELRRLARSIPNGLLVIDEAYVAFAESSAIQLAKEEPNVAVLRTFSKSHSLAGMRLGLLYGSRELVAGLWKVKDSYNLDRLAIVAGAASLSDPEWTEANCNKVRTTRNRTAAALTAMGLDVLPSHANFLFVRMGSSERAEGAYRFLKERGILVRYFSLRLLDDGVRITIGTDAEMDAFLKELKEYLAHGQA